MSAIHPCPLCRKTNSVHISHDAYGIGLSCRDCYDVDYVGDPPEPSVSGPRINIDGQDEEAAIREWNEMAEDWVASSNASEEAAP
jgi:hypothetical protein